MFVFEQKTAFIKLFNFQNMNNLNSDISCKYEVLAEISFHANTSKNQYVKLLCSRLLARSYLRYI